MAGLVCGKLGTSLVTTASVLFSINVGVGVAAFGDAETERVTGNGLATGFGAIEMLFGVDFAIKTAGVLGFE